MTNLDDVVWLTLLAHVCRSVFAMYVSIHIGTEGLSFKWLLLVGAERVGAQVRTISAAP